MSAPTSQRPSESLRATVARYRAHNDTVEALHPDVRARRQLREARLALLDHDLYRAVSMILTALEEV